METQKPTFARVLKAGTIAGFIGAGLNNIWSFIAQAMGSVPPPGFPVAVTISSVLLAIIGAILYFVLVKFLSKGQITWVIVSTLFAIVSCYGPTQPVLPDGTPAPEGFALLAIPMHIISGIVAIWGIPKWSK
jgi:hypothetical protein